MDFISQIIAGLISGFRARSPKVFAFIAAIVASLYAVLEVFSTQIAEGIEPIITGGGATTVSAIQGVLFFIASFLNISLSKLKK